MILKLSFRLYLFFLKAASLLELIAITSLKILFLWAAMQEGMILFFLRRIIDWMIQPLPAEVFLMIRKPLYDCLFCMSSIWGIVFSWNVTSNHFSWLYLEFLFAVAGLNYLIQYSITADDKDSK